VTRFSGITEGTARIKLMRNLPPLSVQPASGFLPSPSPNLPDGTLAENDADAMRESNVVLGSSQNFGLPRLWLTPRGSFQALKYRDTRTPGRRGMGGTFSDAEVREGRSRSGINGAVVTNQQNRCCSRWTSLLSSSLNPDPSPGVGKREGIFLRGQFSNPRVGDRITPATGGRFDRD